MAYETGTASDLADLMTKLVTFAVANGWTQDELNTGTGKVAIHRNSVYVSFRWNTTTPQAMGIYQALGYTGGNDPGQHPNDSGNGAVSATNANILVERCVDEINNGPFPSYFFFEDDVYIHVVVETSTDIFRHFGFGEIDKFGSWTGGEYCYGQTQDGPNVPTTNVNCTLLDGVHQDTAANHTERNATMHVEGLPGQAGSSKWGVVWGVTGSLSNDPAGNARVHIYGGFRGGPIARNFGFLTGGSQSGLVPMYPIACFYKHPSSAFVYFLGYQPDVRGISLKFFAPKDEFTLGSDVWKVFPLAQKTTVSGNDRTFNSGIAYKKVS